MGLTDEPGTAQVTIVVSPREKYHLARPLLTRLLTMDGPPFELIYVDEGRAPKRLRRWISAQAATTGFLHLPLDHHAGVNACRMRGFELVSTPYALFLDNDAQLGADALGSLLSCAEETGAAFVAPLYLNANGTIHYAGGPARLVEVDGRRRLVQKHRSKGPFAEVRGELRREPIDAPEMHAVLVRSASLATAGGMDTELTSSMDCVDLGIRLQNVDGGGWIEPEATVTYDGARPRLSDLPLYLSRWSKASVEHDLERFITSWQLDPGDEQVRLHWHSIGGRRWRLTRYARGTIRRTLGERAVARFDRPVDAIIDRFSNVR